MFINNNLNLLLSSSNFPIFFVRQFLSFDLLEKWNGFDKFYNTVVKSNKPLLNVKFELKLPFSNDLGKFRNRILILLYYFIFELLVGVKPIIKPITTSAEGTKNNNLLKKHRFASLLSTNLSPTLATIDRFLFHKDLTLIQSSNFLFFINFLISRHTYLAYTVPSRLLKVNRLTNSYQFKLNSGLSILDLFSQFDEFILSRIIISFNFSNKFSPPIMNYFLSSFGLNLTQGSFIISFPKGSFSKIDDYSVLIPATLK